VPPQAPDRIGSDEFPLAQKAYAKKLSKRLLEIIDWSMEVTPANRPQTVQELQDALAGL